MMVEWIPYSLHFDNFALIALGELNDIPIDSKYQKTPVSKSRGYISATHIITTGLVHTNKNAVPYLCNVWDKTLLYKQL